MKLNEAKAIIEAIVTLRDLATDEQALTAPALYPAWREEVEYESGKRVVYNDVLYNVLQSHTSQAGWTPDIAHSLFAKVLIPSLDVAPEWEQPDSTNPYMTGNKVSHNGIVWVSTCDNNVWEPGIYGWDKVV